MWRSVCRVVEQGDDGLPQRLLSHDARRGHSTGEMLAHAGRGSDQSPALHRLAQKLIDRLRAAAFRARLTRASHHPRDGVLAYVDLRAQRGDVAAELIITCADVCHVAEYDGHGRKRRAEL